MEEPSPLVYVGDLTEARLQLVIREWPARKDQFSMRNELAEAIKEVLDGKVVVLPQSSIRILNNDN